MKVLVDHPLPFLLAHGGFQVQIEQTVRGLKEAGVDVEFLRWWDDTQRADILHYFGRPNGGYVRFAQAKGMRVVVEDLLTSQGSRTSIQRIPHWCLRKLDQALGGRIAGRLGWDAYRIADACVANTSWEAHLFHIMFGAPKERIHVLSNGVEDAFFAGAERNGDPDAEQYLVCTATITERKRVVDLAEAAALASVPVWIIGRPYAESDPYFARFLEVVRNASGVVRYDGPISDRSRLASIYKGARGFVLLSTMETLSLSAGEAAAAGCPLLLSDLPWARCTFGDAAKYSPITGRAETARILRAFYDRAPQLPAPPKPKRWPEIGADLKAIYEKALSR